MLQGMVIGGCDAGVEEKLSLAAGFIPKIDCWPVCDNFCGGLKNCVDPQGAGMGISPALSEFRQGI